MKDRIIRENQSYRVPVIGRISVGEKLENGQPRSLDYFRPSGQYAALFAECYGHEPKSLEISFMSDDLQQSCLERYENRQGKKLFAYGDGESFMVWQEKNNQYEEFSKSEEPQIMAMVQKKTGSEWKASLTMRFVLLKLNKVFGLWQFKSSAEASSIPAILSTIYAVQDLAGAICRIPFDLHVESVVSQKPGSQHKFPVVKLVCNLSASHLELVSDLEQQDVRGFLTEEKIESLKQIEAPK